MFGIKSAFVAFSHVNEKSESFFFNHWNGFKVARYGLQKYKMTLISKTIPKKKEDDGTVAE